MSRIDLDSNATTPLETEAREAMETALRELPGNPSSLHAAGRRAREAMESAREFVAALIGATPTEISFVSGGTEANNLALVGTMLRNGGALVVSSIEHPSILECAADLEKRGAIVRRVAMESSGVLDVMDMRNALDGPRVSIVSLMLANNETGCIQPVQEAAAEAHSREALIHTDAVQAVGKMPVDVRDLGVDLLTLSAHKIGGPKGIGALWCRRGARPLPILHGGAQEDGLRAGTENVAAAVGFGKAAQLAAARAATYGKTVAPLRACLEEAILRDVKGALVIGSEVDRIANTSCIAFEGIEGSSLVQLLDLKGVSASTGAACEARSTDSSHVLQAMRVPGGYIRGAVRFSLGVRTSPEEIAEASKRIVEAVLELSGK